MYGIEWEQPAIIAEGLAQTAIHTTYVGDFLTRVEKRASENQIRGRVIVSELLEKVHSDQRFVNSVRSGNPNDILNGVEVVCPDEAIEYLSQVKVEPDKLEEMVVENIHTAAYMASASVFHPPNDPRFDFFLIHHLTAAPILLLINQASWIPAAVKLRVLEWKNRYDILHYVVRWCPPLRITSVASYVPKDIDLVDSTEKLLVRFHGMPDDGHVIKLARALVIAQHVSRKYGNRPWIRIEDDATWLRALYLLLDSTEKNPSFPWVRSAGWDGAWKELP
ncbi:hypothetical protein BP6252_05894 [Coleophoma cylindrospora]|uniref:Uncharacterized protein n=1 Tax=Coleophoma cylindrospora TaxID=1849047 RepID=A0A3D8RVK7_9HELO|nr:hypothetical protein BP6252_05894 [Coleophoma cylindrospora]